MAGILYILGLSAGVMAMSMLLPALVAAAVGEGDLVGIFLTGSLLTMFIALGLVFGLSSRDRRLRRVEHIILMLLVWTLVPAVAAVPFVLSGAFDTVSRAYFEAVSAFTTTGASVMGPLDAVPRALVMWHAVVQWIGGAAILLAIVLVLAPARIGGTPDQPLRVVETGARGERGYFIGTARQVLPVYAIMTLACFVALIMSGLNAFDAICLAFGALSTGGFAPRDGSIAAYESTAVEAVMIVFMFIGATSIVWQRTLLNRRLHLLREHRETYWMAAVALALGCAFAWGFYTGLDGPGKLPLGESLWNGLFTAVSVISTSGYDMRGGGGFAAVSLPLLMTFLILGGGGFSTAGGVKFYRAGAMLKQARDEVERLIYPHGVRTAHFGSQPYDLQLMKAIWTGFMAYMGAIAGLMMIVALTQESFEGSLVGAAVVLVNAGPVYSELATGHGWTPFADMPTGESMIYVAGMIVGRLEILAVFALLNPHYWRS